VSPSRSALISTRVPSALGTQMYSGAIVRTVLLWKRRRRCTGNGGDIAAS
jgi:hypothetical protein